MLKIYRKNKDFIINEFYIKKAEEFKENIRKVIFLLVIINIAIMPISIRKLKNIIEMDNIENVQAYEKINSSYNICNGEEIERWINIINDEIIREAYIDEREARLRIKNIDEYYKGYLKNEVTIRNMTRDNDYYTLGVILNE